MSNFFKQFGGKVTPELEERYAKSDHWRDGTFQNFEETSMDMSLRQFPSMLRKQFSGRKAREPKTKLPITSLDREAFLAPSEKAKIIWYGHSVVLMRIAGKTVLIDPMLGPNAAPVAPFSINRFSENTLDLIDDFPEIDLLLMTHDHYDHLDYASIQKLKSKTKQYYVSLGTKRHLVRWGIAAQQVTEFDWYDEQHFEGIDITFTPSRHFSGRGLRDRSKVLWGGWVFKSHNENIWFSGDGGYGKHFKEVGDRKGPFDFAFMECGQYNVDWHPIHLFPDEAVQAALDAKANKAMAVHWGGFSLSYQHTWTEPIEDFIRSAEEKGLNIVTPSLGELFEVSSELNAHWWKKF